MNYPVLQSALFGLIGSLVVVERGPGTIPRGTGTVAFLSVLSLVVARTHVDARGERACVVLRQTSKLALWIVRCKSDHGLADFVDYRRGSGIDRAALEHRADRLGAWSVRLAA